ncbi:hypothetical protein TIFTF001_011752 [Ficus carica]|uniref:Uncharacterized protein n=1 Tax=Ficus carica TaxID=3494 RepID=A0AA87ZUQ8_FICCA|nr:hypothetical protein TIFTF001_011752 [Ficus carica]
MGHGKSVIIAAYIIFFIMPLEGLSVYVISTDLQNPPSPRGSTSTINFNSRRFYHNHGFPSSTQGDHVSQEQKRITPNGANPLHNSLVLLLTFLAAEVYVVLILEVLNSMYLSSS